MASSTDQNPSASTQNIPVRKAVIGKNTNIRRALPSKQKRMIGAWCFLDHVGPVHFEAGKGLDVGPHPHMGLQTFTWMIKGEVMHTDSLGYKQLIRPKQINLMSAGRGISHTEVTPKEYSGAMHAAQLWIAQPDGKGDSQRNGAARFDHYPKLPLVEQGGLEYTVLVGDFLGQTSPVKVATPLLGIDIASLEKAGKAKLELRPDFEYGVLLLEGNVRINDQAMNIDQLTYFGTGHHSLTIALEKGARILLIGGKPFDESIILWWNLVARTSEEIHEAAQHWLSHERFGEIPDYPGKRLTPPEVPPVLKASK